MKAIKFLSLGLLATMIASCSSEDVAMPNNEVAATLTGNIGSSLKTRAFNDQWEANDAIGVFVNEITPATEDGAEDTKEIFEEYFNSKFVTDTDGIENKFTAETNEPILFPSNKHDLSFHAYYPYTSDVTIENPVFTPNWTNQSRSQNNDLLISDTQIGNKDNKTVRLTFKHVFSRIVLNIEANSEETQLLPEDLDGLTVSAAGMNVETSCNVLTGEITKGETALAEEIGFKVENKGQKASAIICPNFISEETPRVVTIKLTNGKTYTWNSGSMATIDFESGYSYTWTLKLKGDGLVDATLIGTIVDWTDAEIEDNVVDLENPDGNGKQDGGEGQKQDGGEEETPAEPQA